MRVASPRDAAVLICTHTTRPGGRAGMFISEGAPRGQRSLP